MKTRNLFISHSWSHSDAYNGVTTLLKAAPYFQYRDFSVPRDDPVHNAPNDQALYDAIRRQMASCQVILILAGVYSTYSKWINHEIRIAKSDFDKPIVGIRPWASERVSTVVQEASDLMVSWNTSSIVDAIRQVSP